MMVDFHKSQVLKWKSPQSLDRMLAEFEVDRVYHLAALLSTRAEFTPVTAHHVNVEGTLNLLEFAQHQGESHGRPVTFVYPSSIAAYGAPFPDVMDALGKPRSKVGIGVLLSTVTTCNAMAGIS